MPLIEIVALLQRDPVDPSRLLTLVNQVVAAALNAPITAVWSTWQTLPPGSYAVGDDAADVQPAATHPPIVHVHARRTPEAWERIVDAVASTLEAELGLTDAGVFVTTAPVRA